MSADSIEAVFLSLAEPDNSGPQGNRLRVLLSAHECSPEQGSECSVGWNLATRLAKYHDVTLLCASGPQTGVKAYRSAIETYLKVHGTIPGLSIVFVDQTPISRILTRISETLTGQSEGALNRLVVLLAFRSWHRSATQTAKRIGVSNFDLTHHLNPIAYWGVGESWKTQKPFCWGPVGGMFNVPLAFSRWLGWQAALLEILRSVNQYRASAKIRRVAKRASLIWAVSEAEARTIEKLSGSRPRLMVDTGTSTDVPCRVRRWDGNRKLLLCWSGRHWAPKALPILLHALSSSHIVTRVSLMILGDGPETEAWKKLAGELGLNESICWMGRLPHSEAIAQMAAADILVHTSIREAASSVLMEALPLGMPVVCHDASGMGVVINDDCGIKIPLESPARSIEGFRTALERFVDSPGLLEKLSIGARKRATELTWDAKAAEIAAGYRECVSAARCRPNSDVTPESRIERGNR
jgi:glycosyltransferase involved in cell wall biosynthesis